MKKAKKLLAFLISLALIVSCFPVFAMAEANEFSYASKIGAEIGKEIINHDYSAMTELPAEITGSASLSPTSAANNENTLTFSNWWSGDGVNAKIEVGKKNFAAKVTIVVDNVQTQHIGGTFSYKVVGKNDSDAEDVASYIRFGLPDRTAGDPRPGNLLYYNESGQYGFSIVNGATPFTTDSTIETYTFYAYSFNGATYYTQEDGTLIGASAHKTGVSDATTIEFFVEYGITYVTDLVVYELNEVLPEDLFTNEKLKEATGYTTGEDIANFDFSKVAANTTPEGWAFNSVSINKGSSDSAGINVLRLANNGGASKATYKLPKNNFAALITVGMDYAQTLAGQVKFGVEDANGVSAAYWSIGLPKRSEDNWPKAGKSCVNNGSADSNFYYPAAGNYSFDTNGYTTVNMMMYVYDGVFTFLWADGTVVSTVVANPDADLEGDCYLFLANDWATAYIHDLRIVDIAPYVAPEVYNLVTTSGYISGEKLLNYDFSKIAANSTPEGFTFTSANIGNGSGETAGKNVLRLARMDGVSRASINVNSNKFAAVITAGIDHSQRVLGQLVFGIDDANGNSLTYWSIGLPGRSADNNPKAGKSCVTVASNGNTSYMYPEEGNVTWEEDGYSTVTMVMYVFENVVSYYFPDGTLVKSVLISDTALENGGQIRLVNDWGVAYIHDLKVYEIVENSFNIDSASLYINEEKAPAVNFNLSYDETNSDIISSDEFEFGAVVTVQDNAIAQNTTIDTENANVLNIEAGAGDETAMYFSTAFELPAENIDKYYNVRTFVKVSDKYFYNAPATYSPAKLANIFYRSTLVDEEKAIVDEFFKDSKIYLGKDSKKTTFTVFSDFHYKQGMYISSIADMNEIFDRANASGSSFVLSAGDMTNDMIGSPELVNALLNNKYGLTAANVYGNHEMESGGNSMQVVTPTLTNAPNVVWGTADGKFDANIGYYYFEADGFRIICTDTNYSWNPTSQIWEHSKTASWGPPSGNTNANAIGPEQIEWLRAVLVDAAENDIPCIVMSHGAFKSSWTEASADAATVQALFNEVNELNPGTVMMHIAGHAHDDIIEEENGIVYFRVNTTRNGFWKANATDHYDADDTFMMETYDADGKFLGYEEKKIGELIGGKNTHFTKEALSATVTIDECGIITIEGMNGSWVNDIVPDLSGISPYIRPQISSYSSFNCADGHIWADEYTVDGDVHYKECINPNCTITDASENAYYGNHEYVDGECVCGKAEGDEEVYAQGDINGDGSVDAADLALLKKVIAKLTPITAPDVKQPDVDGAGTEPDAADLALLKKIIAKLV